MNIIFLYPLNVFLIICFSLFCSLLNLSYFYDPISLFSFILVLSIAFLYVLKHLLIKKIVNYSYIDCGSSNKYKKYLIISVVGFFLEFSIYGIPAFSQSGRDDFIGIPVAHVIFYSFILVSVLYANLYSSIRSLVICLIVASIISSLLLSRQLLMVCFVMTMISIFIRYNVNYKKFFRLFLSLLIVIYLFGLLGNYRQELSGDFFEGYIVSIGGANESGEKLGSVFYWTWLYISSPVYNLIYNINNYYDFGVNCESFVFYTSCVENYISSVLVPNTFVKYIGLPDFKIDLIMEHLNVGTAFSKSARIFGILGVFFQVMLQGIFFYLGWLLTPSKLKTAFIVYFSTLSFFMVFDNLFTHGEFFFVLVIIFLTRYNIVLKK